MVSLGMVLTPGPNMIYLISRSICQGWRAGLISLAGVALGFMIYIFSAAFGLTALLFAVPFVYDTLRILGALYLFYLAWNAIKPGGVSAFEIQSLKPDTAYKLFTMGFLTNLLNPKIPIMYLSLLPQFITPEHGNIFLQSITFGAIQLTISLAVNVLIVFSAASIAQFLNGKPLWLIVQSWVMGTVLAGLAIRMITDKR